MWYVLFYMTTIAALLIGAAFSWASELSFNPIKLMNISKSLPWLGISEAYGVVPIDGIKQLIDQNK